ncbi:MAG: hypothetical protein WAN36_04890, partial [Calditrichia bacterium]
MRIRFSVLAVFILLCTMHTGLLSQPAQFKINHIRIVGNQKADSSIILLNSGLQEGKEITSDDIQRAVKN